jgi:hypothetical protein
MGHESGLKIQMTQDDSRFHSSFEKEFMTSARYRTDTFSSRWLHIVITRAIVRAMRIRILKK